ncbi:MAG: glycerate kinase [Atopobiaceae bacterium]|nr:glycerate kinase [Atopobiaceae bacterium]
MKVVIAIDSFKGSMTSLEAGEAARRGVLRACPEASVTVLPAADGGEGTCEALVTGLGGHFRTVEAEGPLGGPVCARYGILPGGAAVREMAEAAGITLASPGALDPWRSTTRGVGQMVLDAMGAGCREIVLGIGGSATTEAGLGLFQELGWDFLDEDGEPLPPVPTSLGKVARIEAARVPKELAACRFHIACDVTNPLCGSNGAVAVYGPQKGVRPNEVEPLDAAMAHFASVIEAAAGRRCANTPGAGAAGGLGFSLMSLLPQVELRPGVEVVLEAVGLEGALRGADVVITGEGRLDAQSANGKVPVGVARMAKRHGCAVLAFGGSVADDAGTLNEEGIDALFPIVRGPISLQEAMEPQTAQRNLELAVEQALRLAAGQEKVR